MLNFNDILIVIVAYNPPTNLIHKCQITVVDYVIVDNSNSINQTLVDYCAKMENCHYLPQQQNTGIAKALNIGCEYALQQGYQWVVTLDQDSTMTTDILEKMLVFANHFSFLEKTAIISPRHVMQEGSKTNISKEKKYTEGLETMTSGNMVNLEIWKKLQGYDEALFIDLVDTDYYCKAMLQGYKVIVLNQVEMHHHLGNLITKNILGKKIAILNHNPLRKYYQVRNSLYIIKKYNNKLKIFKRNKTFLWKMIIKTLLFERDKRIKCKYIFLGFVDYYKNLKGRFKHE